MKIAACLRAPETSPKPSTRRAQQQPMLMLRLASNNLQRSSRHFACSVRMMSSATATRTSAPEEFSVKVTDFWFAELGMPQWFNGGDEVDALVREKFGADLPRAQAGEFDAVHELGALQSLGLVISLDQFPRNLHRGSAEAFASDPKALALSHDGLAKGYVEELSKLPDGKFRVLFYLLPMMHSENLVDHEVMIPQLLKYEAGNMEHAYQHRDTLLKFGRYPYRNAALGRESTPEELAFLAKGDHP